MKGLLWKAALFFAVFGYAISSRAFITFLNQLNPFQGLLVYYAQLFVVLQVLQAFGLSLGGVPMKTVKQTVGELCILFAFFVLMNQESGRVAYVLNQPDYPTVFAQSEDGAAYYLWSTYVTTDPETARLLTFVLTPAVLVAVGIVLTHA